MIEPNGQLCDIKLASILTYMPSRTSKMVQKQLIVAHDGDDVGWDMVNTLAKQNRVGNKRIKETFPAKVLRPDLGSCCKHVATLRQV